MGSVLLHGIIILALLINWHVASHPLTDHAASLVPVELVTVSDQTNMTALAKQPQPPPLVDEPPAPQSPPSSQSEMHVFPQAVRDGAGKRPDAATDSKADNPQGQESGIPDAKVRNANIEPVGKADSMTMSAPDALRNQIARCWQPNPGNNDPAVTVSLVLDAAGAIEHPPQFSTPATSTVDEPAVEAIRYAIYTCAPYKLPASRFNEWHSVTLTFDPKLIRSNATRN